jgi:prepilin-type N-terminal cleavage/methylation domain-containing protein
VTRPAPASGSARPDHGSSGGFTLVELMVAVVMLSIGILALAQVFAVANRHTSYAREQTAATCLAEEIREKIMSQEYDDIYGTFHGVDTDNPGSVPVVAGDWAAHLASELGAYGRGQIAVDTEDTDPSLAYGMLGVTVTITWRETFGTTTLPLRFAVAKTGA